MPSNKLAILQWFCVIAWLIFSTGEHCVQASMFTCKNGAQIVTEKICDGVQDCDGSDELVTNLTLSNNSATEVSCFHAKTGRSCLLHRDYICNGTIQCSNISFCDIGCPSHYKCRDNSCVPRSTICDGNGCSGCKEDHEWTTGIGFKCIRMGVTCLIPQQLLWDNIQDCDDGSDLCYQTNSMMIDGRDLRSIPGVSLNQNLCFMCLDESMIVPRSKLCDGIIDCSDLSDECLCSNKVPSICGVVRHHTVLKRNFTTECEVGQISCENSSICLSRSKVCDGVADCPLHEDERFEYCLQTLPCSSGLAHEAGHQCRCDGDCLRQHGVLCDGVGDCPPPLKDHTWIDPPGSPADECSATCPETSGLACNLNGSHILKSESSSIYCKALVTQLNGTSTTRTIQVPGFDICNGIVDCTADDNDEKNCANRFTCQSGTRVSIPMTNVCDGVLDCDNKWDENATTCPDRFFCSSLQGKKVSVPTRLLCDFNINCDHAEDEMNCSTANRFYCENESPLFVTRNKVFNGRGDCTDWSDECPTTDGFKQENVLASRYELIGNPFLRALVWIMGLFSLIGNLIVIVGECKKLKSIFLTNGSASLRTNHMLVLNLAISDLLMGIYLIMLGIAGAVYSGVFCSKSLEWLTSQTCVAMGVLVVISSETSMITMVLLTISRLYAISNPLSAMRKPKTLEVTVLLLLTWMITLSIALIPLSQTTQNVFVERALVQDNPFFGSVLNFTDAKIYSKRMLTYSPDLAEIPDSAVQQLIDATSWIELETFFNTFTPRYGSLVVNRYFSFYSVNSVCIPNFFVTRENWAWKFSLSLTIVNFVAFLFVATAYVVIIVKANSGLRDKNHHEVHKNTDIHRKVARLIITDFCCWIPLSIMAFVNFSGVQINSIAYAVAAIVLLPINSALNPILYSKFIDAIWVKCTQKNEDVTSLQVELQSKTPHKNSHIPHTA